MQTSLRASTDGLVDADTLIVTLPGDREIRIYAFDSDDDGLPVIQIDTDERGVGRFRVNVNDGPIWDADPEAPATQTQYEQDQLALNRIRNAIEDAVAVLKGTGRNVTT